MDLDFGSVGARPEQGGTVAPAAYTDPHVFEIEVERIFRREWLAATHEDRLADVGDYVAFELSGDPIVVVRGEDDVIRAFSNVCLHRNCTIAAGSGNTARLTCPYHRWSYRLDGRLRSAPHMQHAEGFAATELRLPELAVEQWQGFVFVSTAATPDPLTPRLAHLSALLEPLGVKSWRIAHTSHWDSPWNWKVLVENFMESYHHIGPHRQSLDLLYPAAGTHPVPLPGHFGLLENPPKSPDEAPLWVINIYPNTLLAVMRGDPAYGIWYQMHIDRHDHLKLDIHLLAPPELAENANWLDPTAAAIRDIHLEDIEVCQRVWRGLGSRYARPGRISHLEGCNWYFYDYLRNMLAR